MSTDSLNGINSTKAYTAAGEIKSTVNTSQNVDDFAKTYRAVGKMVSEGGAVGENAINAETAKKTAQTGDFISLADAQKAKSDILPTNANTQYMMQKYNSMMTKMELNNAMKTIFSDSSGKGSDILDLFSMSDLFE